MYMKQRFMPEYHSLPQKFSKKSNIIHTLKEETERNKKTITEVSLPFFILILKFSYFCNNYNQFFILISLELV